MTKLFSFCDKVSGLVDDEKAMDDFYLNLSKTSNISCNVLEKQGSHGLYRYTLPWEKKKYWMAGPKAWWGL